jgi:transposase InsO family protein
LAVNLTPADTADSADPEQVLDNLATRRPSVKYLFDNAASDRCLLYLALVLDLFSRRFVGWTMAPSMPAARVCDALRMAIRARSPAAGLLVHSDRGSQYASDQYQALLTEHGFVCGISRKGNCWDNAVAERFFLNLKMERAWQRNYANHGGQA